MAQRSISAQSTAKKPSPGQGKVARIVIEFKANGYEVEVCRVPKLGRNGPMWMPDQPKDSMVFTEPGTTLDYLEKCLGPREHAGHEAHEKAKEPGGKY